MNNGRTDDDQLLRPFEDSEMFLKLKQDKISYNAEILKLMKQNDSVMSVD